MHVGIADFARLVIVVDKVQSADTAVRGSVTPVVDNIVADVRLTAVGHCILLHCTGKRPVASGTVDQQIVMIAARVAADGGCK